MAINTSANVGKSGGKTGNYDRAGQSPSKAGSGIKTSVTKPGRQNDNFYGGKPSGKRVIKTTSNCR